MIISAIGLRNWGPYSGDHRVELGPTYYGVVGVLAGDEESSNGSGKSMLLEALPFVMDGWTNPDRAFGSDGWISDGAAEGMVRVEFSDGWWVSRERDTRLTKEKELCLTSSGSRQEEAEREIRERLGLTVDDLFAARFLRQRQAARFVLARPEERMGVVGDWLRLGPLEAAEKSAGKFAVELEREVERTRRELELAEGVQAALGQRGGEDPSLALVRARTALGEALATSVVTVTYAARAREAREGALRASGARARYEGLVAEGTSLVRELAGFDLADLREDHGRLLAVREKRSEVLSAARRAEAEKRVLARGEFDGTCPLAGIQCPARDRINGDSARNRVEHELATRELLAAQAGVADQDGAVRGHLEVMRDVEAGQGRLERIRAEALVLQGSAGVDATPEQIASWEEDERAGLESLEEVRKLEEEVLRLQVAVDDMKRGDERVRVARAAFQAAEERAAIAREGGAVLRSARRKIAESALGTIERDANAALSRMREGLSFELSWSRPGSGLEKTCGECGESYPRGERAKACGRCGVARQPARVERLDVVLSQQSGALEDLVGVFLSLSSAKWLAQDRGSAFESVFLDECTSHLDKAHRSSFARKLPAILSGMGALQGFVVSHDAATTAALPARIVVEGDGRRSTVRVA